MAFSFFLLPHECHITSMQKGCTPKAAGQFFCQQFAGLRFTGTSVWNPGNWQQLSVPCWWWHCGGCNKTRWPGQIHQPFLWSKLLHKDYISRRPEKGGDLLKARNFSWWGAHLWLQIPYWGEQNPLLLSHTTMSRIFELRMCLYNFTIEMFTPSDKSISVITSSHGCKFCQGQTWLIGFHGSYTVGILEDR